MHVYEVRPRNDKRGVDLISDALPFGRLCNGDANGVANDVGESIPTPLDVGWPLARSLVADVLARYPAPPEREHSPLVVEQYSPCSALPRPLVDSEPPLVAAFGTPRTE